MANILYRKQKQQKSLDNGITWIDTGEFRIGAILENPSNCTSSVIQYRWVELDSSEGYWCTGVDKYTVEVEESSSNGIVWNRTGNQRKGSNLIKSNSIDCGYLSVEYRWVLDTSGMYVCDEDTFTKYAYEIEESSTNGGEWRPTGNKRQSTTVLETNSKDCGYCSTAEVYGYIGYYKYPNVRINGTSYSMLEKENGSNTYKYKTDEIVTDISFSTYYCSDNINIQEINNVPDTSNVTTMCEMFNGLRYLTSINALTTECFNTSNVTNMDSMFDGCWNLTSLDLSRFDTSKVTDMDGMFRECSGLTSLDLSNFDTSNVKSISSIFDGCKRLSNVNLSGWDMSKASDLSYLFSSCSNLKTVNLNNFKTTNVTDMSAMFSPVNAYHISDIEELDLSSFDTSSVTNMNIMFQSCPKLKTLNLSNWDTSNVTGYTNMFLGCSGLTTIIMDNCSCETIDFINDRHNDAWIVTNTDCGNNITFEFTGDTATFYFNGEQYTATRSPYSIAKYPMVNDLYFGGSENITKITSLPNVSNITSTEYMFSDCSSLTSLDLSNFKTSNVTDMNNMFNGCSSLTSLDLSSLNISKVTRMNDMFSDCSNLEVIDVSTWVVSDKIINSSMFIGCNNLKKLRVKCGFKSFWENALNDSGLLNQVEIECVGNEDVLSFEFDTPSKYVFKVNNKSYSANTSPYTINKEILLGKTEFTNAKNMFYYTYNSTYQSINKLNSMFYTSEVTDMSYMFFHNHTLTDINTYDWNTSKVTNMESMFGSCYKLTSLDLSSFDTSSVTRMDGMFENCSGLTSLDLSNFNTSNVTNMESMFYGCSSLTSLDLSSFCTINVTSMYYIFRDCSNLTTLDVSSWETKNIISYNGMFSGCTSLREIKVKSGTESWWRERLGSLATNVTFISIETPNECINKTLMFEFTGSTTTYRINNKIYSATSSPFYTLIDVDTFTSASSMFNSKVKNIKSIPDTTNVTDMSSMFGSCSLLTSLDLSNFNTSNAINMGYMFSSCSSLTSLDLSNFDTTNVTDMSSMFYNCISLTSLNLSNFDTSNVTNMQKMFANCSGLTSLDLSNFNTSNVTNMDSMFYGCRGLTSLDLSGWNTSNVTDMDEMFRDCRNLTSLDLSGWDLTNTTNIDYMFYICDKLTSIICIGCNETTINKLNSVKPTNCTLVQ